MIWREAIAFACSLAALMADSLTLSVSNHLLRQEEGIFEYAGNHLDLGTGGIVRGESGKPLALRGKRIGLMISG